MGQHMELRQAQAVGHRQHVFGMLPQVIATVAAAMVRTAMADQVGGHHKATVQHRCQAFERGSVIQPAMQGQYGNTVFGAPGADRYFNTIEVEQVIFRTAQRTHCNSPWLKPAT
ncbi:hypothetical protein D3C80_1404480 [compost metagenome]